MYKLHSHQVQFSSSLSTLQPPLFTHQHLPRKLQPTSSSGPASPTSSQSTGLPPLQFSSPTIHPASSCNYSAPSHYPASILFPTPCLVFTIHCLFSSILSSAITYFLPSSTSSGRTPMQSSASGPPTSTAFCVIGQKSGLR